MGLLIVHMDAILSNRDLRSSWTIVAKACLQANLAVLEGQLHS